MNQDELKRLLVRMLHKSAISSEFRQELLADTDAALEKLAGKKLPEGFRLKVVEPDPAYTATIVLPDLEPDASEDNNA